MKNLVSLLVFLTAHAAAALGADGHNPGSFFFTKVNGENGLSHNTVKAILQDSRGFMWFGTRNKLDRYDGASFKIFDCYDRELKRGNNSINALFEDDKQQLWIGTDKGIFLLDPVTEKLSFFDRPTDGGVQMKDWVSDIHADNDRNIWIVIPNQGVFKYVPSEERLHLYVIGNLSRPDQGNAQCMTVGQSGHVWIGTNGGGIHLYNKEKNLFVQYLGDKGRGSLQGENIYAICDAGEELIIGIHEGKLMRFHKRKNTLTEVNAPEVHYKVIRYIFRQENELWVGTSNGLFIVNEQEGRVTHLREDFRDSRSLSDNMIHKIYRDRENGIWIATNYGGVNYLPNSCIKFDRFIPLDDPNSISSKKIGQMKEDALGNIWIATEDAGVNVYNPATHTFRRVEKNTDSRLQFDKVLSLYPDGDRMWVGRFKNGLDVVQTSSLQATHYSGDRLGVDEPSIYSIYEDRLGRMWIGNGWEVYRGNKQTMKFQIQPPIKNSFLQDIAEDADGYLWVSTMGNGVYRYNLETDEAVHFTHNDADTTSISSNSISDITIDSRGRVWFSTDRGGICCYQKENQTFTAYSVKDGLPDDVTYKILEDKNHNLWFGTNNGLVKFNPQTRDVRVFRQSDGLPGNQFNYKSALAASNGIFYFGGLEGLVAFNPYQFNKNTFVPPVYITKLTLSNREMDVNTERSPLDKSIIFTHEVTFNHDQTNLRFNFVALSYTASKTNRYAYKMDDIDTEWLYTSENQSISYAKLPPGNYTFRVKGSNNDGVWNKEGTYIHLTILPPWWQSTLAYCIYFLLLVLGVFCWVRWFIKKQEKRTQERQRMYEAQKEKELYNSKLEFFTNIAHEIRIPVTLINGPLELLQEMDIRDEDIRKNVQIMRKNTSELLHLINQLLDFRKADSSKFLLTFAAINLPDFLREIHAQFAASARQQNKQIHLLIPEGDLRATADRNALTKILNNLFSNAVRYSEQWIEVELSHTEQTAVFRFSNDGSRVLPDQTDKIFEPFYQLDANRNTAASSGIGLSLARTLVEQHHGKLYFDIRSPMNTFILELPLAQAAMETPVGADDFLIEENETPHESHHPERVLFVEDNPEMRTFVADRLRKHFAVETADNGMDALQVLPQKRFDLILTDVMMPKMDGLELCKYLKDNMEYSHIPIVMLTARNDLESKIAGLKAGADAYVEKPFSFNYLISQLTSLLDNRQRERTAFMQRPFLAIREIGMNKTDEAFLSKTIDIIHQRLTHIDFNVEHLAELVCMSRSSLHRKIKALSGLAPTDFIRLIRLKKAAELIAKGDYQIGEVCYLVGINSPSYFIKLFYKQFGMTPKEFKNQQQTS
jgi:signal transduction histidine kinase/ligand-binding sensor domain-containing protein/DNA-binding response OmpR family regulator